MKLTDKQKAFLAYLSRYQEEWGRPPSFEEIRGHFGFRSYNTVTTYLKHLERKGYVRLPEKKNRKRGIRVIRPLESRSFEVPLLGRVAAGKPLEAVEDKDVIEVPPSMASGGEHFVLVVAGDSMRDEGILDGDYVVVRRQPTAENGDTVVALLENEATVKKYYRMPGYVELRPAHQGMASIIVREGDLRIEGKVVGVIRHYK